MVRVRRCDKAVNIVGIFIAQSYIGEFRVKKRIDTPIGCRAHTVQGHGFDAYCGWIIVAICVPAQGFVTIRDEAGARFGVFVPTTSMETRPSSSMERWLSRRCRPKRPLKAWVLIAGCSFGIAGLATGIKRHIIVHAALEDFSTLGFAWRTHVIYLDHQVFALWLAHWTIYRYASDHRLLFCPADKWRPVPWFPVSFYSFSIFLFGAPLQILAHRTFCLIFSSKHCILIFFAEVVSVTS